MGALNFPIGASAHIVFPNGTTWYFNGAIWPDQNNQPGDMPEDPVNVIFLKGGYPIDQGALDAMIANNGLNFGGAYGCGSRARMIWRNVNRDRNSDKEDYSYADEGCGHVGGRYHVRLWDDLEHRDITANESPNHGAVAEWLVGSVHHEHRILCFCGNLGHHQVDEDWDQARREFVQKFQTQCRVARWRALPGAKGFFGRYTNSGLVGRISKQQVSQGCTGA